MTDRRTAHLRGILAAVPTPFAADGSVDEDGIQRVADRLIDAGIHGIVATGTTGEFTNLTDAEYLRVMEVYVTAAAGRVPVVAGVGAMTTPRAIELAQHAEKVGATAIMLVPPFYDPLDFDTLKVFLRSVAGSITIPIVYYNVPGATGVRLSAAQVAELGDIPGLDYLKDTSGDAVELAGLLAGYGDRIKAFNGWDTLTFFGIASGAEASVWGLASILPAQAVALWDALAVRKDLDAARELWKGLWKVSEFLESVNYAAAIKAGVALVGHPVGEPRLPILPLSDDDRARFAAVLAEVGALTGRSA